MPVILAAVVLILAVVLLTVLLIPVALVQRYRAGTARRRARAWLAAINVAGLGLSIVLLLAGAAMTNIWVPHALAYTSAGVVAGAATGLLGLGLTRWERAGGGVHYTPNRWLVLAITLAVAGRLIYGVWRAWEAWGTTADEGVWLAEAGTAGSLAAGALVLGYYLTYWLGVRRRALRG